jgi:hypothetical protein
VTLLGLVVAAAVQVAANAATGSAANAPSTALGAPPLGTYTYTVQQGGNDLGTATVSIGRSDVGLTVHEDQTLQGSLTYAIDEIFDATTFDPRAYTGAYARGNTATTVRVVVDSGGATVTIDGTSGTAPFPNPSGIKHAYIIEGTLMSGYVMLPAQLHASKATQFSQISPRSVSQMTGTVDLHPALPRPASVPPGDVALSVTGKVNFDVWYDPATMLVHAVSAPGQQLLITLKK